MRVGLDELRVSKARILRFALVGSVAAGFLAYPLLVAIKLRWDIPEMTWWQVALAPPVVVGYFNAWLRFMWSGWRKSSAERGRA